MVACLASTVRIHNSMYRLTFVFVITVNGIAIFLIKRVEGHDPSFALNPLQIMQSRGQVQAQV